MLLSIKTVDERYILDLFGLTQVSPITIARKAESHKLLYSHFFRNQSASSSSSPSSSAPYIPRLVQNSNSHPTTTSFPSQSDQLNCLHSSPEHSYDAESSCHARHPWDAPFSPQPSFESHVVRAPTHGGIDYSHEPRNTPESWRPSQLPPSYPIVYENVHSSNHHAPLLSNKSTPKISQCSCVQIPKPCTSCAVIPTKPMTDSYIVTGKNYRKPPQPEKNTTPIATTLEGRWKTFPHHPVGTDMLTGGGLQSRTYFPPGEQQLRPDKIRALREGIADPLQEKMAERDFVPYYHASSHSARNFGVHEATDSFDVEDWPDIKTHKSYGDFLHDATRALSLLHTVQSSVPASKQAKRLTMINLTIYRVLSDLADSREPNVDMSSWIEASTEELLKSALEWVKCIGDECKTVDDFLNFTSWGELLQNVQEGKWKNCFLGGDADTTGFIDSDMAHRAKFKWISCGAKRFLIWRGFAREVRTERGSSILHAFGKLYHVDKYTVETAEKLGSLWSIGAPSATIRRTNISTLEDYTIVSEVRR